MLKHCFQGLVWLSVAFFFLWAAGAIYYLLWLPQWMRPVCCAIYVIGFIAWIIRSKHRHRTRAVLAGSVVVIFLLTLLIRPSNDRNWADDQARVAKVEITDGVVTIGNFKQLRQWGHSSDLRTDTRTHQLVGSADRDARVQRLVRI